jgi:hypothetical protein
MSEHTLGVVQRDNRRGGPVNAIRVFCSWPITEKREDKMAMMDRKQASLIAGIGAGAAMMLFTDAGRAARRRVRIGPEKAPRTNHQLAARVCVELDHQIEHAKGIQVFADKDRITLRGIALREELDDVLNATQSVNGVNTITNQLEVLDRPGKMLALQE